MKWFKKGYRQPRFEQEDVSLDDVDAIFNETGYSAETILTLLKELNQQDAHEKIDWKELVRKSSTGITNAREYQMIWRYLAYQAPLDETLNDDAEPLDDDSDIDCEVEVLPPVAPEVSAEAAACVKVLISASHLPSKSTTVPKGLTTTESLDTINGAKSNNVPPKRKIMRWSDAEDKELIAAVQKYGEGNWTYISHGEYFKSERSASQLSKRWNIIKKNKDTSCLASSSQFSATRHALSLALDMPKTKKFKASSSSAEMNSASAIPNSVHSSTDDQLVRSTALAVGVRIGTPDDEASLPKVAHNLHYIRTAGLTTTNSTYHPITCDDDEDADVNICD